jgi:dolichol-phosphate mannosyltransferase
MYDLTIIIPTLNEQDSITDTLTTIVELLEKSKINGQILVVDDDSKDNTIPFVRQLQVWYPNIDFIVRKEDHGLSQSLVDGFHHATTDIIMVIDADGQHPFEKIPEVYQAIIDGNDVALGSRYMGVEGSESGSAATHRKILSWGATVLSRFFFPSVTDSGSGFFAFRKEVIKDAPLKPQGFRMLFEVLGKGHWKTAKEVPIILRTRKQGESKLTSKAVFDYLKQLWGLFTFSWTNKDSHGFAEIRRLVAFMLVGISGVCVNLSTLYIISEKLGVYYAWAGLVGIEASIITNFILNETLTFRDIQKKRFSIGRRLINYHWITLVGSTISYSLLLILTTIGFWYLWSAIIGILIAFIWNFAMSRSSTWVEG